MSATVEERVTAIVAAEFEDLFGDLIGSEGWPKRDGLKFKSVGKKSAEKYLRKLYELVFELRDHLAEMPSEAREALSAPFPSDLHDFKYDLVKKIAAPASEAIKAVRILSGRKGRREDWKGRYVTRRVDETYKGLVGRAPTREELQGLLEGLFPTLKIESNPEHCVRVYRERMKRN
jgi:hypothetical protein